MPHCARALVVQALCLPLLMSCASPQDRSPVPASQMSPPTSPAAELTSPSTRPSEEELAANRNRLAAMRAEIEHEIEIYRRNHGRSHVLTANEREARFANYAKEWAARIERVGNANYPAEARGRMFGSVHLRVTIKADGSVQEAQIERSSGHEVLDQAALRILKLASPFQPFPPEIAKDNDTLVIPRVWSFVPGNEQVNLGP